MKKLRLIAMFALTFALVFGVASCKNEEEEGPWGESLAEVLKAEPKLKFDGKWKATDADLEVEIDCDDPEAQEYLESLLPKDDLKESERIAFIADEYFYGANIVIKDNDLILNWLAEEARTKAAFKNGPINYYGATQFSDLNVMVNGDRDEIRIEGFYEMEGTVNKKHNYLSQSYYVTYTKQK